MQSDSFFTIGSTHKVCQDYASAGEGYCVLSDGCSMAEKSELGAIILNTVASNYINKNRSQLNSLSMDKEIIKKLLICEGVLGVEPESWYATLVSATAYEEFKVFICGDGVASFRERDSGDWMIHRFEYPSGAPYYPAYELGSVDKDFWINKFGSRLKETTHWINKNGETSNNSCFIEESKGKPSLITKGFTNYDACAIFSDGVNSFQKNGEPVNFLEVLREFLGFLNYKGQFVQRRCSAVLKRMKRDGVSHYDDFSMGAIVLNE